MQLIERLRLHNYKCHRDLDLTFGPGVTGIVGDNGSGKSSIISGIRFLFTGEVDTDNKQKSITLGETEGWVTGKFNINGKEGSLERHLGSSKVVLKYDGVTYNKAAEVKELWAKLLQIDTSIFNNIIIAAQGEIPLLFSGDSTVREKIFQKIFLVPPTEKLRSTIWDQYIKTCPPEKFEEDVTQLQSQQAQTASKRNAILASIDQKVSAVLNEAFLRCVLERIAFLEKCQRDAENRPALQLEIRQLQEDMAETHAFIDSETKRLGAIDYLMIKKSYEELISQKKLVKHKEDLENELALVEAQAPTIDELEAKRKELETLEQTEKNTQASLSQAVAESQFYAGQLESLTQLEGQTVCPTCQQPIADITDAITHYKAEKEKAERNVAARNASYVLASKKAQRIRSEKSLMEGQYQRLMTIQQQLSRFGAIEYSEENLRLITEAMRSYNEAMEALQACKNQVTVWNGDLAVTQEKLKNLAYYDGQDSIEVELITMNEVIQENQRRLSELENLKVEQAKYEHELQLLEERIEVSIDNHRYNVKRQEYLNKLNTAYEILHVHQFPRMLIQSYAEHVQVYLSNYLEKFNIPYQAKIKEGFKIIMVNENGEELPTISGGQEVIVGLCLRLALHKMFAQSFPLWIVDEGTTHLSESNRKAYFRLIEEMRTMKIVDQVLIIDHDSQLSTVVDKTIQL